jgi:putative transposase
MGRRIRKRHGAGFKAKVALAAAKGDRTLGELASQFAIHATQVSSWKKQLLDNVERLFSEPGGHDERDRESRESELFQQIGQLKMELEWLKKKAAQFD